jgi:hypothetical protein
MNPPTICANSEILESEWLPNALKSSLPRYKIKTRINVSGTSPLLKLVNDAKSIIMNTTPLAPRRPVEKKITFSAPVTRAVMEIIIKSETEPYTSSSIGPISKINAKLEKRWGQLACPSTCVKSVIQFRKLKKEKLPLPGTINHWTVSDQATVWERIRIIALAKAKVRTVGALYFIFIARS